MATAREKLAAIRGGSPPAPPQTPRQKLAKIRTRLLDEQGLTGAEVKRRAAAGEPIVQSGLRRGTRGENMAKLGAAAVVGAAEGLGGTVGLGIDTMTAPFRGIAGNARASLAGIRVLHSGGTIAEANAAAQKVLDEQPTLPATRKATDAADDLQRTGERILGVEGVASGTVPEVVRFGVNVAMPGPEGALVAREVGPAARAAMSAEGDTARIVTEGAQEAAGATRAADGVAAGSIPDAAAVAEQAAPLTKYAEPSAINLERQNAPGDVKRWVADITKSTDHPVGGDIAGQLEALKGAPLTEAEIRMSEIKGRLLTDPVTRAATEQATADMLRSRNALVDMEKAGAAGRLTPDQLHEYLALQRAVSTSVTDTARQLNALKIRAGDAIVPGSVAETAFRDLTEKLIEIGKTSDEIVDALKGVNFNDTAQATSAFKKHIKPKFGDLVEAYRYTNLLSSPKTHIVNISSNLVQATIARPADLLTSGATDWFASKVIPGRMQTRYVSDVGPYVRGLVASYPKAVKSFVGVMTGRIPIRHLDLGRVARFEALPAPLKTVTRLLEGIDRFGLALVEGGEFERIAASAIKSGRKFNEVEAAKEATRVAEEYLFRTPLDPENASGQGYLLSAVDQLTARIQGVLESRVGKSAGARWAVPFIRTPMNIFKRGIERGPLGFATMYGSTRKTEQFAKAINGSVVMLGAGFLAMDGRTTWSAPRDRKDRAAFYAAGLQPYSVKIGDTWVSYTKLGPLAYPIAFAAAAKYQMLDNPEADGFDAKFMGRMVASLAEFFSDQSYMQGVGDLLDAARGNESVIAKTVSNFATQLVPLSSLQRWVTQIVDPVYRKGDRDLSVGAVIQNIKRGIPGLSQTVPPYTTPSGKPSERQMPVINAVSPLTLSREDPEVMRLFKAR